MRVNRTALALVFVAACGPYVSYAPLRQGPPLPPVPTADVEVLVVAPPCPFVELGMLEAQAQYARLESAVVAMRETAGKRGADAILVVDRRFRWSRDGSTYSAIAISREASCRKVVAAH